MAEAKDPRRDAPFALFVAMTVVTLLYRAIQYVARSVASPAAATERPLAAAARQFSGASGASLISAGALISLYGYLSAQMLHTPRRTFALGEKRRLPAILCADSSAVSHAASFDPGFRGDRLCLAAAGNFQWNVILSSVGRCLSMAPRAPLFPCCGAKLRALGPFASRPEIFLPRSEFSS